MKRIYHTGPNITSRNRAVLSGGSFCFPCLMEMRMTRTRMEKTGKRIQPLTDRELQGKVGKRFFSDGKAGPFGFRGKSSSLRLRYFSRKPCAIRHGTAGQARNKISALQSRGCLTQKTKGMSRSNFTPMGRFKEIIDRYGLKLMEVGTNHLRIFADNRKLFDYYPLRMKLFDYRQWKQLTYPSLIEGADKWETELDEIIKRLMVSPQ